MRLILFKVPVGIRQNRARPRQACLSQAGKESWALGLLIKKPASNI